MMIHPSASSIATQYLAGLVLKASPLLDDLVHDCVLGGTWSRVLLIRKAN
jgi:hypothetical protein